MAQPGAGSMGGSRHEMMGVGGGAGTEIAAIFTASTQGIEAGAGRIQQAFGNTQKSIAGFVGAVSFALITRELIKLTAESIKFERIASGFEALANRYGLASAAIVKNIQEISQGQIAIVNIMESVNKALTLLPPAAERMTDLITIATGAAAALGLDVRRAFDDITTGIGRASPKILDNLGIIVNAREAYRAYSAEIGKSVTMLGAEEKQIALLNQVIVRNIDRFGEIARAVRPDIFQKAAAAATDLRIAVGDIFAPIAKETLAEILGIVGLSHDAEDARGQIKKLADAIVDFIRIIGSLLGALVALRTGVAALAGIEATRQTIAFAKGIYNTRDAVALLTTAVARAGVVNKSLVTFLTREIKGFMRYGVTASQTIAHLSTVFEKRAPAMVKEINAIDAAMLNIAKTNKATATAMFASQLRLIGIFTALAVAIYTVVTSIQAYLSWLNNLKELAGDTVNDLRNTANALKNVTERVRELVTQAALVPSEALFGEGVQIVTPQIDVLEAFRQTEPLEVSELTEIEKGFLRVKKTVDDLAESYRKQALEFGRTIEDLSAFDDAWVDYAEAMEGAIDEYRLLGEVGEVTQKKVFTAIREVSDETHKLGAEAAKTRTFWTALGGAIKGFWVKLIAGLNVFATLIVTAILFIVNTIYQVLETVGVAVFEFFTTPWWKEGFDMTRTAWEKNARDIASTWNLMIEETSAAMINAGNVAQNVGKDVGDAINSLEESLSALPLTLEELNELLSDDAWDKFRNNIIKAKKEYEDAVAVVEAKQALGISIDAVEEISSAASKALNAYVAEYTKAGSQINLLADQLAVSLGTTSDELLAFIESGTVALVDGVVVASGAAIGAINEIVSSEALAGLVTLINRVNDWLVLLGLIEDISDLVVSRGGGGKEFNPIEEARNAYQSFQRDLAGISRQIEASLISPWEGLQETAQEEISFILDIFEEFAEIVDKEGAAAAERFLMEMESLHGILRDDLIPRVAELNTELERTGILLDKIATAINVGLADIDFETALALIGAKTSQEAGIELAGLEAQLTVLRENLALLPKGIAFAEQRREIEADILKIEQEIVLHTAQIVVDAEAHTRALRQAKIEARELVKALAEAARIEKVQLAKQLHDQLQAVAKSFAEQMQQAMTSAVQSIAISLTSGDLGAALTTAFSFIGEIISEQIISASKKATGAAATGGAIASAGWVGVGFAVIASLLGGLFDKGGKGIKLAQPVEVAVINEVAIKTPALTRPLLGSSGTIFSSRGWDLAMRGGMTRP